jgi:hypothetical protein
MEPDLRLCATAYRHERCPEAAFLGGLLTASRVAGHGRLSGRLPCRCAPTKLSAIKRWVNARQRLIPGGIGVQVLRQFYGVVQYPTDNEQGGLKAENREVARPTDDLRTCTHLRDPGSVAGATIEHPRRVRAVQYCPALPVASPRCEAPRRLGSHSAAGRPRRIARASRKGY